VWIPSINWFISFILERKDAQEKIMAISNDLLSSTLYSIRDGEVDELYKKVAFLDGVRKYGGVETEDGGIKIQRPLSLAEHSSITQLATGYEPVNLAVNDVLRPAIYDWCDFVAPIVVTKKEEMENSGDKAIVKIVEARMKSVMGMLRRELNKQILQGNSAVLTAMNTLNGDTAGGTGFLEPETPADQTNVVGGISKVTFPVGGWLNQFFDVAGAFATNGLKGLTELTTNAQTVAPMGDIKHVIMSTKCFALYRESLRAQERYIDMKTLDGGRLGLAWAGAVAEADPIMGFASNSSTAGAGFNSAYLLNYDGVKLVFHSDGDFAVSPFEHISGTTARSAQLYVKAQLVADFLGGQGLLFDAES
jgi:hypothetical protein